MQGALLQVLLSLLESGLIVKLTAVERGWFLLRPRDPLTHSYIFKAT